MKIYLDTSVYNRPFDDQTQPRIWLETLALFIILLNIENKVFDLVTSTILDYENSRNPHIERKSWVETCFELTGYKQKYQDSMESRIQGLCNKTISVIDAMHIVFAEYSDYKYFITCDDKVIKKYNDTVISVISPLNFILNVIGGNNDTN